MNIDRVTQVDRFPLPGETIVGRGPDTFVGGKGANQASAIAQLIGRCVLVGAVGNDADGTRALQELRARGVDTTPVAIHPELPTGSAHIRVDAQGENTIVIHPGANAATAPAGTAVEGRGICVLSLEIGVEAATHAASAATGTVILTRPPPSRFLRSC